MAEGEQGPSGAGAPDHDLWTRGEPRRPPPAERERWLPPMDPDHVRYPESSPDVALVWDGVVWGRLGRGDLAWACWDAVGDGSLTAWVAAERGRVLRELGLHERARELEEDGLSAARDVTDAVMLRVSLAADALGAHRVERPERVERAERQLAAARALLDELPPGPRTSRQRIRARWVAAEIALAAGDRDDAVGLPARGEEAVDFPGEYADGTDFHRAKGLLVAGVVRDDRWLLARAAELAPPQLLWAVELARLDAGEEPAAARAASAWRAVRAPAAHATAVAATPTALRLRTLE